MLNKTNFPDWMVRSTPSIITTEPANYEQGRTIELKLGSGYDYASQVKAREKYKIVKKIRSGK